MIRAAVAVAALPLLLAGCGSTAPASPSSPAAPASAVAPAQLEPAPARTAEEVVADLTAKVGAAKSGIVYTADTDPNKLLGRPNGYTSKASFTDSRVKAAEAKDGNTGSVDLGGSVEVYADDAAAAARKQYIDGVMKASPALGTEYSYVDGPVLLRVSQELTPDQAAEYEAALQGG